MSRVVVLGMDGLDPDVLERMWADLPNFRRLRDAGTFRRIRSVYPPDSVPAWATIYTGLTPDEHGILDSIDYLDIKQKNLRCDTAGLRDNTFWDEAGRQGRKVCVINPFLAYPVWRVNGVMVNGPVFVSGELQSHPESILADYAVPELGGIVDQPTKRTLGVFAEKTKQLTLDLLRFGKELFKAERPDMFFINFLALDRVQHSFWRYCDPQDPTYPGENPYSGIVDQFYRLHDSIVGEFLDLIDDDTVLLILSDHGHGRRCTKALCVNELLRQRGLLKAKTSAGILDPKYLLEKAKTAALRFLDRHDLQDLAFKVGRLIPGAKSLKKSTFVIDKGGSAAGVARFAGMNPYGGIDLPRDRFDGDDAAYSAAVDGLIADLNALQDPDTGKRIVNWAMRREEMFIGKYANIYPEIIFQLDFDYGVSRSLFGPLVDINPTHRKVSGGHMPDAALLSDRLLTGCEGEMSVLSIAPTVLNLLDVSAPSKMTGCALKLSERSRG
ncbi:MAG: alkaline phosphatase family protein [Armatimonadetes bacterium]|nr:alkaline phosphatase family protein [Armatimonadota bacterium]